MDATLRLRLTFGERITLFGKEFFIGDAHMTAISL